MISEKVETVLCCIYADFISFSTGKIQGLLLIKIACKFDQIVFLRCGHWSKRIYELIRLFRFDKHLRKPQKKEIKQSEVLLTFKNIVTFIVI